MRFYISTGYGYYPADHKESHMLAEEDAYFALEEGLEDWLNDNMPDRHYFETDLVPDEMTQLDLYLVLLEDIDAMAYKLRWE